MMLHDCGGHGLHAMIITVEPLVVVLDIGHIMPTARCCPAVADEPQHGCVHTPSGRYRRVQLTGPIGTLDLDEQVLWPLGNLRTAVCPNVLTLVTGGLHSGYVLTTQGRCAKQCAKGLTVRMGPCTCCTLYLHCPHPFKWRWCTWHVHDVQQVHQPLVSIVLPSVLEAREPGGHLIQCVLQLQMYTHRPQ
jgi:hypothetical protein